MQKEFSHIKWSNKETSLARANDMYNYAVTQEKLEINNKIFASILVIFLYIKIYLFIW